MGTALQQLVNTLFAVGSDTSSSGVISTVFSWITSSAVLPYLAIGIGCSLALFGVKIIRGIIWGA